MEQGLRSMWYWRWKAWTPGTPLVSVEFTDNPGSRNVYAEAPHWAAG